MAYQSIAIIGDSQAEGLSAPLRTELLRAGVGPVNGTVTISGIGTRELTDRGKPAALMAHTDADLVIVALGGNDTASSRYGDTLEEFISGFKRSDGTAPEIVWIGPAVSLRPDVDARHALVSAMQSQVLPALGVRWFDSREWTASGHGGDDVHFTREAYQQQAQEIVARILSSGSRTGLIVGGVVAGVLLLGGAAFFATRPRKFSRRRA